MSPEGQRLLRKNKTEMSQEKHSRHAVLSETTTFDRNSGDLRIVIETPKGSRNKYKYEPECDCLELTNVLPEGKIFPYDFGFIPSTIGPDGDPLDVLVLMDAPVVPGCVIRSRLLGVIKARQRDKEQNEWVRNDRLIAVACHAQTHQDAKSVKDLRPHLSDEIVAFFVDYNKIRGREFEQLDLGGPRKAMKIVEDGAATFKSGRNRTVKN
jgi:inorganic pyrophosphatase